ncbi:hypothetical protein SAMN05444008_12240 [Cnuella takakiae]|uniref:Uncharacterized protein n=1 Tax=Cnuella takakiae TaxID=1302690 RepID=A0A1M5I7U1_9BACT|nr:hypothetical protein SAMN05444008_12240 [Cnuella takakiae]
MRHLLLRIHQAPATVHSDNKPTTANWLALPSTLN